MLKSDNESDILPSKKPVSYVFCGLGNWHKDADSHLMSNRWAHTPPAHPAAPFLTPRATDFQDGSWAPGHTQAHSGTDGSNQTRRNPQPRFHKPEIFNEKEKHASKNPCVPTPGPVGEKAHTAICSCLQIVLSRLSNQMSFSARGDPNSVSSLAAGEQKGPPLWFNNSALTLVKAT